MTSSKKILNLQGDIRATKSNGILDPKEMSLTKWNILKYTRGARKIHLAVLSAC